MIKPAERMTDIPFSGVRSIFEKALSMERSGKPVIHLEIGRPDFDTPEHIKAAACRALGEGKIHYTSNYGIPPLRRAIADKLAQENALDYSPEDEIIVTNGVSEGIMITTQGLLNPGDEVMLLDPVFPAYEAAIRLAGGVPVPIPISCEETYQPDISDFEARLTSRTKMLIFCNPCNPTGITLKPATLAKIADFAIRKDLLVVSDEIYEKIVYHGQTITSIASLPGMRNRTITLNGFSKTYAMTGWRIGWGIGHPEIIGGMSKIQGQSTTNPCSIAQAAALAALSSPTDFLPKWRKAYIKKRNAMCRGLGEIPGVVCDVPDGAFYVLPSFKGVIEKMGDDATDVGLAAYLLDEARVATVPGSAFGAPGHLRLSYATGLDVIDEAVSRIRKAVEKL